MFGLVAAYGSAHAFLLKSSLQLVLLTLRGYVWPEDSLPELELRREPRDWRRAVAALIVAVVQAHLQEERQRRTLHKASVWRTRRRKCKHEGFVVRL